ncbi:uncharacterized protein LTR77_010421 [Saxophila tyrrhenica]|uniref:Peptide N-acetyl-beta-D-glucosaminyl asparaginase amidase A N-terminal domain-containing protein n=1 Tax=Saxophila tyrrhenica TaxID=1690608 RepID=A0AAV9NVH5_9PEZI|nr:hypothetical protein LTR77_010421 [Saxophila tyrrhenica]
MSKSTSNVDGVGNLTYQRAIDIARNTEGELDPTVNNYLEGAITDIWNRVNEQQSTYVLTKDEFAVFNYYIRRFEGSPIAEQAIDRTRASVGEGVRGAHPSMGSRRLRMGQALLTGTTLVILLLVSYNTFLPRSTVDSGLPWPSNSRAAPRLPPNIPKSLLEVFQVYPPVLAVSPDKALEITDGSSDSAVKVVDSANHTRTHVEVEYSFANSYGQPFVGHYTPPACSFNRVTWNLTVVSAGKQFDRLAFPRKGIVYLGDVEVFRTSTAEPTPDGIRWTYLKDMTSYLSLFKKEQEIIFDLGNLINNVYTAPFNVTLTASYFTASDSIVPADVILPVSAGLGPRGKPSVFTVPPNTASSVLTLPQNVKKAVFTIAATGQSEEEFWWSNVLQSDIDTYHGTELYGYSAFREVQLYIDGMLAGVVWPFPVIFTGGVVPGLWRPIVGIDAFDLKEDEIDITPFLPLLCDGKAHNFTIRVSGLNDDGHGKASLSETTDSYWLVTGKVFVWLDKEGHITTGSGPTRHTPAPVFDVSSSIRRGANGTNGTLLYHVNAHRSLSFHSEIALSHGREAAFWQQDLSFSNFGNFSDGANVDINNQNTHGVDISSSGYMKTYDYPLYAFSVFAIYADNISITANVNRGKEVKTLGQPVFPTGLESLSPTEYKTPHPRFEGAWLSTTQNGSATYLANETSSKSFSFGTTAQDFTFTGLRVSERKNSHDFPPITGSKELFHRYVKAVNGTVIEDDQALLGDSFGRPYLTAQPGAGHNFLLTNIPGRGGNWHGRMDRHGRGGGPRAA